MVLMPPAARITKEMILNAVLELTRKQGFEAVNARSIAMQLQCSTRPIFTCYENMEMLKREFLEFGYRFYEKFVGEYRCGRDADAEMHTGMGAGAAMSTGTDTSTDTDAATALHLPLSYIAFAQKETHLFRLLFVSNMALSMTQAKDFYTEIGNETRAAAFSETISVDLESGKRIFLDLFLYTHGIAVLSADKKISLQEEEAEKMIQNVLSALIIQEKKRGSA